MDGIATGALFAFFCSRTGAFASIATVGFDLPEGSHWRPAAIIGLVLCRHPRSGALKAQDLLIAQCEHDDAH